MDEQKDGPAADETAANEAGTGAGAQGDGDGGEKTADDKAE